MWIKVFTAATWVLVLVWASMVAALALGHGWWPMGVGVHAALMVVTVVTVAYMLLLCWSVMFMASTSCKKEEEYPPMKHEAEYLIVECLRRGPYSFDEIAEHVRAHGAGGAVCADDHIESILLMLERTHQVKYMPSVGLYKLA